MTTPLFSELDLSPEILQALTAMGFEAPTPIQHQCIPALREGRDVLGQAQTGTGKTAAFGIPALEHIDVENRNVQALVLCPTRELAIQITGELMKLGQFKKGIHIVPVYGGQPIDRQLKALKRATHIVVGTPGRVIDHLERRTLDISQLSMFVLDEADEMLNMGFREDIENISKYCSKKPQTVMFSATVSAPIRDIINRQMVDPVTIRIDKTVTTSPNIEQYIVEVRDSMRTEAISRIMDVKNFKLGLIFTNTKMQADALVQDLGARGYDCDVLHGDMKQSQRDTVMGKFRRTGRAGRSGTAITFAAGFRNRRVAFIEKMVKTTLKPMPLPSVKEVEASRASEFMGQIRETLEAGGLRPYIEMLEGMEDATYSPIEIAAACLKMQVALKPEQAKEFDAPRFDRADRGERSFDRQDRAPRDRSRGGMEAGMTRLFINVGKTHNVRPGDLVGAIAGETGLKGSQIGQISLQQNFSLVDVPSDEAQNVINKMGRAKIKGNKINIRLDRA